MEQMQQFKLNIPKDVMAWVASEAVMNTRSRSGQIIHVLKEKMEADQAPNE